MTLERIFSFFFLILIQKYKNVMRTMKKSTRDESACKEWKKGKYKILYTAPDSVNFDIFASFSRNMDKVRLTVSLKNIILSNENWTYIIQKRKPNSWVKKSIYFTSEKCKNKSQKILICNGTTRPFKNQFSPCITCKFLAVGQFIKPSARCHRRSTENLSCWDSNSRNYTEPMNPTHNPLTFLPLKVLDVKFG